jgi:hydrogenase maturation protein HypF
MEPALISLRFHTALENVLLEATKKLARKYGLNAIALSGGCLMNERLRERLYSSLETEGFRVLFPKKLPTNDGGISFGQVVVANQLLEGKESCVWQYR